MKRVIAKVLLTGIVFLLLPVSQVLGLDIQKSRLAAGMSHTLAIRLDGTLWSWGNNEFGQLGVGDRNMRLYPTQIGMENTWTSVAAGAAHTLALKADGTLWAWGNNAFGQVGDGTLVGRDEPVRILE